MKMHKCKICEINKLEASFHMRKKKLKDGTIVERIGQYKCKDCLAEYQKSKFPYKRKLNTPEEVIESYKNRKGNVSKAVAKSWEKRKSIPSELKPIRLRAVNINTGEVRLFNSALDASISGEFINTSISRAIGEGRPYSGYFWTYIKE